MSSDDNMRNRCKFIRVLLNMPVSRRYASDKKIKIKNK